MCKWVGNKILRINPWGVAVILTFFLLVGCSNGGRYKIIMGGIQSTNSSLNGSYKNFSGYYYKTVKLKANDQLHIRFDQKTESGSLTAELLNDKGQILFKSDPNNSSNKEVSIPQTGRYRVEVIGSRHSGSFNITWNNR